MTEVWWGLGWTCPKYGCQIQGLLLCVLRGPLCSRSGLCAPEASVILGGSIWGTLILCWSSWVVGQFGQAPPPGSSTGETLQWRIDTWKLEGHCHPEERTICFYVSMPVPLYWSLRFIAAEAREASSLGKVFTTQIQGPEFDYPPPPPPPAYAQKLGIAPHPVISVLGDRGIPGS